MRKFEWNPQLRNIKETVDLNSLIKSDDIISIDDTIIEGDILSSNEYIEIYINVSTILKVMCSKTLKLVEVQLDFDLNLIFGNTEDADYLYNEIDDLFKIVYGHILIEKPYVIHHPDAEDLKFEKPKGHIAFADLLDK